MPKAPVGFLLVLTCALPLCARCESALPAAKPNILLVLTDDQGYGDLSLHGNPVLKTPNMDRIGAEGVRFDNFHVSPTCSPTRSALLSGRHEFLNGVTHTILERERMRLETITLAQVLKRGGYTTGIFGKWHLGDEDAYQPDRRGFDEVFIHGGGGIGQSFPGSCGDAPGNTYFNPVINHNGRFEKTEGYCTDVFFGQAMKWAEAVKPGQPFFAMITTNAPHGPLNPRPEDEARYAGKVPGNLPKFFGMISNIDDNLGRMLAWLDQKGLSGNTLVIFMTDNGSANGAGFFNAGMRGQKGTAWRGGTRVPSFWRLPGRIQPGICNRFTAHMDVLPTLADLAGVELDEPLRAQVEGRSLAPLLANPQAEWADRLLFTHLGRWPLSGGPRKFGNGPAECSVQDDRYALVRTGKGWSLFDYQADPGQKDNLAGKHPQIVEAMSRAYDQWWERVLPGMVNEEAHKSAPKVNPFKKRYQEQFGKNP